MNEAGAPLVRTVLAELGEGVSGVLAGIAADVLVFSVVVGTALLWAVNFLVYRPRQLRAFGSAVAVEASALPGRDEERTRHFREGSTPGGPRSGGSAGTASICGSRR